MLTHGLAATESATELRVLEISFASAPKPSRPGVGSVKTSDCVAADEFTDVDTLRRAVKNIRRHAFP